MIDDTMAERMVACGWLAAAFVGVVTLVGSLTGELGLTRLNLIDAGILLALAYGIYRRSRTCAVLMLVYHLANRGLVYTHASYVPNTTIVGDLVLAALFILGAIGTFVHHARLSPSAA